MRICTGTSFAASCSVGDIFVYTGAVGDRRKVRITAIDLEGGAVEVEPIRRLTRLAGNILAFNRDRGRP